MLASVLSQTNGLDIRLNDLVGQWWHLSSGIVLSGIALLLSAAELIRNWASLRVGFGIIKSLHPQKSVAAQQAPKQNLLQAAACPLWRVQPRLCGWRLQGGYPTTPMPGGHPEASCASMTP